MRHASRQMPQLEDWMDQQGALVGTRDGDPALVEASFAGALVDLGYRLTTDEAAPDVVMVQRFANERGAWGIARIDAQTARALATRLANRSCETACLLSARATFRDGVKPACLFDAKEATVGTLLRRLGVKATTNFQRCRRASSRRRGAETPGGGRTTSPDCGRSRCPSRTG